MIFEGDSLKYAGQNCHYEQSGAYTGEISAEMIADTGAEYVIVGHSERRRNFGETNEMVGKKVAAALRAGLKPIVCCGETIEQRKAGKQSDAVKTQLTESLFSLSKEDFANVIIAYEPVWAIGTGENATPEQAQEMHGYIRGLINKKYAKKMAEATPIIYGGSCNAANAKSLFKLPDVDGGLIGGASLKAADFVAIVHSFPEE